VVSPRACGGAMLCWIDTHGTGEPLLRGLDASYRRDDIVRLCVRRESTVAPTGQARQPVQRLALGPRRGWVGHQGRHHARPAADGGSADDGSEGRPRGTVGAADRSASCARGTKRAFANARRWAELGSAANCRCRAGSGGGGGHVVDGSRRHADRQCRTVGGSARSSVAQGEISLR
jgi:hypothetical protein